MTKALDHRFCIAPMLDCTDRHQRYFMRQITRHAVLYTEMITTGALIHGHRHGLLAFDEAEHPVAIQLGGSDPSALAQCALMAQDYGYDEVNLNVGCPSSRVQSGGFGASLMADPALVAHCVHAMQEAIEIPVTVKCRIGIDDNDSYDALAHFIQQVSEAGCTTFIIHARKAWLTGLSPKENREIPPLRYDVVYAIKRAFPQLEVILNGGLKDLDTAQAQLEHVDGVMMGREAYANPYLISTVDRRFFDDDYPVISRTNILENLYEYALAQEAKGMHTKHIARHLFGLFQGIPGAKAWRRHLSEHIYRHDASYKTVMTASQKVLTA